MMEGTCSRCVFPLNQEDWDGVFCEYEIASLIFAAFKGYEQCVKDLIEAGADVNQVDEDNNTALMGAVYNGELNCVNTLVKAGADVNRSGHKGNTALHSAAGNGYKSILSVLLAAGADVNLTDDLGRTALHRASFNNHVECLCELIKAGADVNIADKEGDTPLMKACREKKYETARILIKAGADVNKANNTGHNALIYVSHHGNLDCVRKLLDARTDVNSVNNKGKTALMSAAMNGHDKCVDLLVRQGAAVNLHDDEGFTALMRAAYGGHIRTVCELTKTGVDVNALYGRATVLTLTAIEGFEICMKELIKAGADVNKPDGTGMTPLMHAVANGQVKCVQTLIAAEANVKDKNRRGSIALAFCRDGEILEALLQAGADVNESDNGGHTPLIEAAGHAEPNYLKKLLQAGADVDAITVDGFTALIRAVWSARTVYEQPAGSSNLRYSQEYSDVNKTVSLLIDAGANVNIALTSGLTALMQAVLRNHWDSFLRLIRAGAHVNQQDIEENTAITIATSLWRDDYVEELIRAGADVNVIREDGLTPLMMVSHPPCGGGDRPPECHKARWCIKLLVEAGADVNMTDPQGNTALTTAAWNNRIDIVKELLHAGARVNIANSDMLSRIQKAIVKGHVKIQNKDAILLLFVAGEWNAECMKIAQRLLPSEETTLRLENICRDAIRMHLLHLDPHSNLFGRIPRHGLPTTISDFLLYFQSLESK